jgi:ClpP class serine protease
MPLYDEDGNPVEGAVGPEKLKEINEKVDKVNELLKEKEEELEKHKVRAVNFKKLRNKAYGEKYEEKEKDEKEKEEMLKGFNEKERIFAEEIADLRGTLEDYHKVQMSAYEDEVIKAMVGTDEDQVTKLKETAKEFVGTPKTKEDIFKRYKSAYTLIEGKAPSVNPINQFTPTVSHDSGLTSKPKKYTETEEGEANYKRWFPDSPLNKEKKE